MTFVSRAGEKLAHALQTFHVSVSGYTCADFGCSTGGFTDCLLQNGAAHVYAIDTGYGVIDWKLRNDPRVTVMERTNAMHVELPVSMDLITMDTSWTKVKYVLPKAFTYLKTSGTVIALIKPHYEATERERKGGILPDEVIPTVLERVREDIHAVGGRILAETESPIVGGKGKNREFLWMIKSA